MKRIIDSINKMSGKYSSDQIFNDWVTSLAISISNSCSLFHDKTWQQREELYRKIIEQYEENERYSFIELTNYLVEALENNMCDVLGEVYMRGNMGSDRTGQFFTPFHLSKAVSDCSMVQYFNNDDKIIINEPSCGGGGMIIAAAKTLMENGINYQSRMEVVAQDLDWRSVYMCYCQLSLLGISATITQGDTLLNKKPSSIQVLYTPKKLGVLL